MNSNSYLKIGAVLIVIVLTFVVLSRKPGDYLSSNTSDQKSIAPTSNIEQFPDFGPSPTPTSKVINTNPKDNLSLSLPVNPAQKNMANTQNYQNVDKLIVEDIKVGDGPEVKAGDTVVMNYLGTLVDGTKFDSSYDRGQPFTTQIGAGQVIKGWDQGVPGMKVGGKRKLVIPSDLAYGDQGIPGAIPPKATLIFEVELVQIQ